MNNYNSKIKDWYNQYNPNASVHERSIFNQWAIRVVKKYYQELENNGLTIDSIDKFFFQKYLSYVFPTILLQQPPLQLPDVKNFIEIFQNILNHKDTIKICIYADRDADGITSSSILVLFLRDQLKVPPGNISLLLPFEEDKYGVTDTVAQRISQQNFDVFIALDCASANKVELQTLQNLNQNAKYIIIDHHYIPQNEDDFPNVDAFVNTKRLGLEFSERDLCTASLVFKLVWAFTYSYTSIFNKIYLTETNQYIQNGIVIEKENIERYSEVENINVEQIWQQLISESKEIEAIDEIIRSFDAPLTQEKLWITQQHKLSSVFSRTENYLGLTTIGIIGDMMPLLNDNRLYVNHALKLFNNSTQKLTTGLKALLVELGMLGKKISEQDLGFNVSPALNAPGRLGDARLASNLLIANDEIQAARLASEVKLTNEKRKKISKENLETILNDPKFNANETQKVEVVYSNKIHRGISGLVANKLAETWKKPVIVLVDDGNCIRGSIRSYQNENSFALLESVQEFFIQFGGHRQAAGFSIEENRIESFEKFVIKSANTQFKDASSNEEININDFNEPLYMEQNQVNTNLWKLIDTFAPYGILNPHPIICIENTVGVSYKNMGKEANHARLLFSNIPDGRIEGVWFFHQGNINIINENKILDIFAQPHYNEFQGKLKYQLKITNIKTPD